MGVISCVCRQQLNNVSQIEGGVHNKENSSIKFQGYYTIKIGNNRFGELKISFPEISQENV